MENLTQEEKRQLRNDLAFSAGALARLEKTFADPTYRTISDRLLGHADRLTEELCDGHDANPWTHWCVESGSRSSQYNMRVFSTEEAALAYAKNHTLYSTIGRSPKRIDEVPAPVRRCRRQPLPAVIIRQVVEATLSTEIEEFSSEHPEDFAEAGFANWEDQFVYWEETPATEDELVRAIQKCVRCDVWEHEDDASSEEGSVPL